MKTNNSRLCEYFEKTKYRSGNFLCNKNCPYYEKSDNTCPTKGLVFASVDLNFEENLKQEEYRSEKSMKNLETSVL